MYPPLENSTTRIAITGIPVELLNQGRPELSDKDMARALNNSDFIIEKLTKHSLFSESTTATLEVHRMIQEIIKKEVFDSKKVKETLENAKQMLDYALHNEHTKEEIDRHAIIRLDRKVNYFLSEITKSQAAKSPYMVTSDLFFWLQKFQSDVKESLFDYVYYRKREIQRKRRNIKPCRM